MRQCSIATFGTLVEIQRCVVGYFFVRQKLLLLMSQLIELCGDMYVNQIRKLRRPT